VVFTLVFWAFTHLYRDKLAPGRREKPAILDTSQIKVLAVVSILGTCAAWIILGVIWYFMRPH
jgi:hypothetical protein